MGHLSVIQVFNTADLPEISQVSRLDAISGPDPVLVVHDPATDRRIELELSAGSLDLEQARSINTRNQTVDFNVSGSMHSIDADTLDRLSTQGDTAFAYLDGVAFAGNLMALHRTAINGQSYLLSSQVTGSGLSVHRIETDGSLSELSHLADNGSRYLTRVSSIESVEMNGRQFVVTASASENGFSVFEQSANGALQQRGSLSSADGVPIDGPSNLSSMQIGERRFVLATSFESGSLTVLELGGSGTLSFVDQVNDSQDLRFAGATALDTISFGGQNWVGVAGNDGGVSLFQLSPTGSLFPVDTIEDTIDSALTNISQLRFFEVDGSLELFALARGDNGITRLAVDVGPAGGSVPSAQNDMLQASDSGGPLDAGAGDDVLIDGLGSDIFTGGVGADVFVFLPDARTDTITDFNPDQDRIDLSSFFNLREMSDLTITQIPGGVRLNWLDESLTIYTENGAALDLGALTDTLRLADDRVTIPDALPQFGSSGNDVFVWTDGPDTIDGGAGIDRLDYGPSNRPAIVDLQDSTQNAGSAAGDVLSNIEALSGTRGNDVFLGNGSGNTLTGLEGNDRLEGRGGNDWINPGKGRDTVDGGAGSDMVSFSDHQWSVRVDLGNGVAEGNNQLDTLLNIENVTGTIYGDYIVGDAGDNRIRSLGDYDWLVGSDGSDQFDGGTGRDMVSYVNAPSRVVVNLGTGRGTEGQAAGDTYTSIERITGSVHSDQLYGGDGEEDFRGLGGYDWFIGSGGGKDRYDGGNGSDTVAYWNSPTGVVASLHLGRGSAGDAARDLYTSIENLAGSSHADILTGDNGRNTLRGYWGEDTLIGGGGVDRLNGGGSNDTLDGGSGWDYAQYSGSRRDYSIETDGAITTVTHLTGNEGIDMLTNIEALQFADDFFYL